MESRRTIPLHEEVLSVGKRAVETSTVRVDTHVHAREQTVEQELDSTTVDIVRVPVGRVVETVPEVRQDGDVLIVPVLEEELVVTKRLVLKEEIHITRQVNRRTEQVSATLRTEEASITRDPMPGADDQQTRSDP